MWDFLDSDLQIYEYNNIISALKQFHRPNKKGRDITFVEIDSNLNFFLPKNSKIPVKGGCIREQMKAVNNPGVLPPMLVWDSHFNNREIDWRSIFINIYNICRNQKLIQFQYKLLMRISTSRYMRNKMGIAADNLCTHCNVSGNIETLEHIFFHCPTSKLFTSHLNHHISKKFDNGYSDHNFYYFITCNHENANINYLNLASKWYLSRCYQMEIPVAWSNFVNSLKNTLIGEKKVLREAILDSIPQAT